MRSWFFISRLDLRFGSAGFYAAALAVISIAYAGMLALTYGASGVALLTDTVANVVSAVIPALAVRLLLRRFVFGWPALGQVAAHTILSAAFAILWFWLLMVLLGAANGESAVAFSVRPFLGGAAAWQLFQGLTIYALVAVSASAEVMAERLRAIEAAVATQPGPSAFRLFVKQDDELRPLDTDRIILIRGADDYSEIVTTASAHLVRMTLAALGERLGDGFIRVHRSCLANVARIGKAEPAGGGRMLLHMENGEMITTSRAGARLLRERII